MRDMARFAAAFLRDRRGGTAIEYGLIISLVILAIIASLSGVASKTIGMWTNVHDSVADSTGGR